MARDSHVAKAYPVSAFLSFPQHLQTRVETTCLPEANVKKPPWMLLWMPLAQAGLIFT